MSVFAKVFILLGNCPQQLCLSVFVVVVDIFFFSFVITGKAIVVRLEVVCRDAYVKNVIFLDPYVPQALSYSLFIRPSSNRSRNDTFLVLFFFPSTT